MPKIEKLPSGMYRIRANIGKDENGHYIRKSFTGPDKKQLMRIAAEYADQHRIAESSENFGSSLDGFLRSRKPVLSPSTMRSYIAMQKALEKDFARFCSLKVGSISSNDVQTLINRLVSEGKSPKTIRNYHALISAVMKFAGYNTPIVQLPASKKPVYNVPDEETVRRLAECARGTEMEIPIALAAFGLRRGEICSVTKDDLDGNVLHICHSMVMAPDRSYVVKQPKTLESDRYIEIPEELADKIRKKGRATTMTPSQFSHRFSYFLKANGFEHFRLHDMRHFFASYCHNVLKLSDKQIEKMGGWDSDYVMRSRYMQSMDDQESSEAVLGSIGSFFA